MTQVTIDTLVPAIRALSASVFRRESSFHLSACGVCGGPTFQYPCPSCSSWYDFSDGAAERRRQREVAASMGIGTREDFVQRVDRAGGLGCWYFANFRKVVAYKSDPAFRDKVDHAIERAYVMWWPDAGEVWDTVKAGLPKLPEDSFYREAIDRREARALDEFGEAGLQSLKSNKVSQHSWPENCEEGRDLVARMGEEWLAEAGIAPAPTEVPCGP